jgi:alkylhydroperoxidase family enzyme
MAYVRIVPHQESQGRLRERYDQVLSRGRKVINIVSASSLRPALIETFFAHYQRVMHSPDSGLSRAEREMLATVTSAANRCQY